MTDLHKMMNGAVSSAMRDSEEHFTSLLEAHRQQVLRAVRDLEKRASGSNCTAAESSGLLPCSSLTDRFREAAPEDLHAPLQKLIEEQRRYASTKAAETGNAEGTGTASGTRDSREIFLAGADDDDYGDEDPKEAFSPPSASELPPPIITRAEDPPGEAANFPTCSSPMPASIFLAPTPEMERIAAVVHQTTAPLLLTMPLPRSMTSPSAQSPQGETTMSWRSRDDAPRTLDSLSAEVTSALHHWLSSPPPSPGPGQGLGSDQNPSKDAALPEVTASSPAAPEIEDSPRLFQASRS